LQIPSRRIRVPRPRESRKVSRNQLQSLQIVGVAQRILVTVSETDVGAVQAEVRQIGVAVGVAGGDGTAGEAGSVEIVRVVAAVGAVEVIVVGSLEGSGGRAGVHGCFVDAAEGLVGGDAAADVEGVKGQVA